MGREGVRKGPAADAERDASQHAVCLDQWSRHGQTNIFLFLKTPRGALSALFLL